MALDWTSYDRFDWSNAQQSPMNSHERESVERLASDVLGLSPRLEKTEWGQASPPGRYAATVINIRPGLAHGYRDQAERHGISDLGVKIFKGTPDARREAGKIIPFHLSQLHRLPGLPNPRVPMSLAAAFRGDRDGVLRGIIVQEWMPGLSLEDYLRRCDREDSLDQRIDMIKQILAEIVAPLWAVGTVWWDFRDANFCYAPESGRIRLIDVDSLGAYADEILEGNGAWERREKGSRTALARLRRTVSRLLDLASLRPRSRVEAGISTAWTSDIEAVFGCLGRGRTGPQDATVAVDLFCEHLRELAD